MPVAEIVPATEDHIVAIAKMVRPEDKAELWAACLQTPDAVMRGALERGHALTGLVDGEPVCMWGVVPQSLLINWGAPWMVGTTALERHALMFLRRCRKQVLELFAGYDMLLNYVDARNARAIQWLKWLGFTVEKTPEKYGFLNLPFHKFSMEVRHV